MFGDILNIMQSYAKRASSQALKLQAASVQAFPQRLKLQAFPHKIQDPRTRVQAYLPLIRGTSNKDKRIQIMLYVKANLVG
jgi:hypothetical protein